MATLDRLSFQDLLVSLAKRYEEVQSENAELLRKAHCDAKVQNGAPHIEWAPRELSLSEVEDKHVDQIPTINVSKTSPSSAWQRPDGVFTEGGFQISRQTPILPDTPDRPNFSPSGRHEARVAPPVAQLVAPTHDAVDVGMDDKSTGTGENSGDPPVGEEKSNSPAQSAEGKESLDSEARIQEEKRLRRQFKRLTQPGRRRFFAWQGWQVILDMHAQDKVAEPTFTMEKLAEAVYEHTVRSYQAERFDRMTTMEPQIPSTITRTQLIPAMFLEVGLDLEAFANLMLEDNGTDKEILDQDEQGFANMITCMRRALRAESGTHNDDEDSDRPSNGIALVSSNRLDTISACVIMLNALVIGISTDIGQDHWIWEVFEVVFTVFFLGEMLVKMRRMGLVVFFIGSEWHWNNFDFFVVAIAIFDMAFTNIVKLTKPDGGSDVGSMSSFTIIKMARLGRLARLVRLLRFKIFEQLKMMIEGVFAGLRVLFWAVVLLFFFIYLLGIVLRKTMGDSEFETARHYALSDSFETVPRSMFTLFRCFTDGCVAYDGTPLQVHLFNYYGAAFMIPYMLVFLFVTMGIFNLIMAIFIDNVMEASVHRKQQERGATAATMELALKELVAQLIMKRKITRGRSQNLQATVRASVHKMETHVGELLDIHEDKAGHLRSRMTQIDNQLAQCDDGQTIITRENFDAWLEEPAFLTMLEDLDIGTSNKSELFDVLDCDLSGELEVPELVQGLMKLRGPSDKSDAVASLLGVRYMTSKMDEVHALVRDQAEMFQALRETTRFKSWSEPRPSGSTVGGKSVRML